MVCPLYLNALCINARCMLILPSPFFSFSQFSLQSLVKSRASVCLPDCLSMTSVAVAILTRFWRIRITVWNPISLPIFYPIFIHVIHIQREGPNKTVARPVDRLSASNGSNDASRRSLTGHVEKLYRPIPYLPCLNIKLGPIPTWMRLT